MTNADTMLALVSDLYGQVVRLTNENASLRQQLADALAAKGPPDDPRFT